MKLYIAEKPSLGRAIARALPQPCKQGDGFITAANGDQVSWCVGHLLEQAEPEAYDARFKQWSLEHLPIIPEQWQLRAKPKMKKQLAVLRRLVKQADQLVHAGDPDREGQLLVDEVINFLGVKGAKRTNIERLLISDLNKPAVARQLQQLRSNREFIPLSVSALARSRADWLYGINLTRAYTLQGRKVGYQGVLSVGRVQTPLLGLVVRRDRAVEAFDSQFFFEVWAPLTTSPEAGGGADSGGTATFWAKWQPSEACGAYLDEQGRNLSEPLARNVAARISGKAAQVLDFTRTLKRERPPLPHSLSSLQIEAGKVFGLSAKAVLDACQILYERHQLITYPRSDSRHLPRAHHTLAPSVLAAIQANTEAGSKSDAVKQLGVLGAEQLAALPSDSQRLTRAWNDTKVDAHHAIIPTAKSPVRLQGVEAQVYSLVARQYVAQFLDDYRHWQQQAKVEIGQGLFVARARQPDTLGWKALLPSKQQGPSGERDEADEGFVNTALPELSAGQALSCATAQIKQRQTSPPKPFSDATLLAAMTGIGKHVADPSLQKILKETDGLGTEATRAGIIELLFKREFLTRQGKSIRATAAGRAFIEALPEALTWPDMTARWEASMAAICERQASYDDLMGQVTDQLQQLVAGSVAVLPQALAKLPKRPPNTSRFRGKKGAASAKQRQPSTRKTPSAGRRTAARKVAK